MPLNARSSGNLFSTSAGNLWLVTDQRFFNHAGTAGNDICIFTSQTVAGLELHTGRRVGASGNERCDKQNGACWARKYGLLPTVAAFEYNLRKNAVSDTYILRDLQTAF